MTISSLSISNARTLNFHSRSGPKGLTRCPSDQDLLGIVDDRAEQCGIIIAAQLPAEHWRAWIDEAAIADVVPGRKLNRVHRLTLKGKSLRRHRPTDGRAYDRMDSRSGKFLGDGA